MTSPSCYQAIQGKLSNDHCFKMSKFDELLNNVSAELNKFEATALNLLLVDFIPKPNDYQDPCELFANLCAGGYLLQDDTIILRYVLLVIERHDLYQKFLTYIQDLSNTFQPIIASKAAKRILPHVGEEKCSRKELGSLSHLRKISKCEWLYKFACKLPNKDIESAKYYLQNEIKVSFVKNGIDLLLMMHRGTWGYLLPKLKSLVKNNLSMTAQSYLNLLEMAEVELFPEQFPKKYRVLEYYGFFDSKNEFKRAGILLDSEIEEYKATGENFHHAVPTWSLSSGLAVKRTLSQNAPEPAVHELEPFRSDANGSSSSTASGSKENHGTKLFNPNDSEQETDDKKLKSADSSSDNSSEGEEDLPLNLLLPSENLEESPVKRSETDNHEEISLEDFLSDPHQVIKTLPSHLLSSIQLTLPDFPFFKDNSCLESLSEDQMKEYFSQTAVNILGKGAFGCVYKGSRSFKQKQIAVKVQARHMASEKCFRGENSFSYIKHTFLLPAFAICETETYFYIMYPLMEGGDLCSVLRKQPRLLDGQQRFRILWQLAEVLKFLHEPVENVRGAIIHGDIKPSNVLLDAAGDIRLGDLGLSVELDAEQSAASIGSLGGGTPAFSDSFCATKRRPCNDIFSFGVLGLVLLSGQEASQFVNNVHGIRKEVFLYETLIDRYKRHPPVPAAAIDQLGFINYDLWTQSKSVQSCKKVKKLAMCVAEAVSLCLVKPDLRTDAHNITLTLRDVGHELSLPLLNDKPAVHKRCNQCGLNYTTGLSALGCPDGCKKFCLTCLYLDFRNPLFCPEHGRVHAPVGHSNSYALLLGGQARNHGEQMLFDNDLRSMVSVVSDPRIMGIRTGNVFIIQEGIVQLAKAVNCICERIREARHHTPELPSSLLLYYTGHCKKRDDGSTVWYLPNTSEEFPCSAMCKALEQLHIIHITAILDCCYAKTWNILPGKPVQTGSSHSYSRTLWAAADFDEVAEGTSLHGSRFTKYVIAGLRSAQQCLLQRATSEDCTSCRSLRNKCSGVLGNDHLLTVSKLQEYVFEHVRREGNQNPCKLEMSQCDHPLAYFNRSTLGYALWFVPSDGSPHLCVYLTQTNQSLHETKDHLFSQIQDVLCEGVESHHLMLEHITRKGISHEITDTSMLRKYLETRGELLRVKLRSVETNKKLCTPFYKTVNDRVVLGAPMVLLNCATSSIHSLIHQIQMSTGLLHEAERPQGLYTEFNQCLVEVTPSLDRKVERLVGELTAASAALYQLASEVEEAEQSDDSCTTCVRLDLTYISDTFTQSLISSGAMPGVSRNSNIECSVMRLTAWNSSFMRSPQLNYLNSFLL